MVLPHHEEVAMALLDVEVDVRAVTTTRAHHLGVAAIDRNPSDRTFGHFDAFATAIGIRPEDKSKAIEALQLLWSGSAIDLWRQVIDGTAEGLRALARGHRLGVIRNADGTVEAQLGRHGLCQIGAETVGLTALHFDPLELCISHGHAHVTSLLEAMDAVT
jgi:hypothetical protein